MAEGFCARLTMEGMEEAQATAQIIRARTKPVLSRCLEEIAQRATLSVSSAVSGGTARPHSSLTLRKYRIGKTQGAIWPPIPPYPSARPLRRSGALANAIDYEKMAPLRFVVGVDAGAKGEFSGGMTIPLSWIAALQETGFTRVLPVSLRMRHYLRVLWGEVVNQPTGRHLPPGQTGRVLTVWVPARPVWGQTFDRILEWAPTLLEVTWFDQLGLKAA